MLFLRYWRRPGNEPMGRWQALCAAMMALILAATSASPPAAAADSSIAQKYRELILRLMAEQNISGLALAVVAVPAWLRSWWGRGQRWHYTALAVAAPAETALLAGWRLIDLG
jgi:hypothetical protein